MDLQTSSNLNLQITKDDLIDLLVDEQLTKLEAKRDGLTQKRDVLEQEKTSIFDKSKAILERKLHKLLPIPAKKEDYSLSYNIGYTNSQIAFIFKGYTISLSGKVDCSYKHTEAEKNRIVDLDKKLRELHGKIHEVKADIAAIIGNNKRIKAQMLRKFLGSTLEGRKILSTLGKTETKMLEM